MITTQRLRAAVFALSAIAFNLAQAQNYTTQIFNVHADIREDRSVDFTEDIHVTFLNPQHGLKRTIPVKTEGKNGIRVVRFILDSVEIARGGNGYQPANVSQSGDGDVELRIGDANQEITGPADYRIKYSIDGAITDFADEPTAGPHSELYWNMIPAHWATPIEKASFSVTYPPLKGGQSKARIYIGPPGSTDHVDLDNKSSQPTTGATAQALYKDDGLYAQALRPLLANEGMTAVVSLPLGTLNPPPPGSENGAYIEHPLVPKNSPLAFFIPFIPVALFVLIYSKRIRIRKRQVTVAFEAPPELTMLEAGALVNGDVTTRDFVAGVVSLAQLKLWLLVHNPDNSAFSIEFIPPKIGTPADAPLRDFLDRPLRTIDQQLYNSLLPFAPLVSPEDLKGNFAPAYAQLRSDTNINLAQNKLLYSATDTRGCMGCLLIILIAAGVILGQVLGTFFIVGTILAVISMVVLMGLTSKLTDAGFAAKDQLLGLKEFITRSYQRELNYFAKTDFNQALYDRLLPYAIMFNAVKQWTQAFDGIDLTPPDWYIGYDPTAGYWYDQFAYDSGGFHDSFSPSPTTTYGSGGDFSSGDSGFSGGGSDGGGGGGGGDSW